MYYADQSRLTIWSQPGSDRIPMTSTEVMYWAHPIITAFRAQPPANAEDAQRCLAQRRIYFRRKEAEGETVVVPVSENRSVQLTLNDQTLSRLLGLRMYSAPRVDWKQDDGEFLSVDRTDVAAMHDALLGRQQRLFALEAALNELVRDVVSVDDFLERVENFNTS